jgi:hypothetical protein
MTVWRHISVDLISFVLTKPQDADSYQKNRTENMARTFYGIVSMLNCDVICSLYYFNIPEFTSAVSACTTAIVACPVPL